MTINRSFCTVFLIICAALLLSSPATAEKSNSAASGPIEIGSILILSGEGASWGNAAKNGMEMAIEEINSQGGVLGRKLAAVHQDDQGDPKKSISAFSQLNDVKGIKFIIGPTWSNLGLPLIDMATRAKVLLISPSLGVAKFNESSEYLYNTWPHDFILSRNLADYVYARGHRYVALVGAEHVWVKEQTQAFKARFEELGGTVPHVLEPLPGTSDLRNEALRIKGLRTLDAVVSTSDGVITGSLVAKSFKELNFEIPIYSITVDQTAIDAAQGGFEGMEFLTYLTPRADFKKKYESTFKTTIDIGADSAYDAVMMLAQAMRETGSTDATILARKLADVKVYEGASGRLVSDGRRGFTKDYAIRKVIAGKPVNPDK